MVNLKDYISEGNEVKLIVRLEQRDGNTGHIVAGSIVKRVRKYKVTKVYPYICMCQDKNGEKRVAGIGDLVMSHSLLLPNNPLELSNIEEER